MREVSLRELINYVRVVGGYAGYSDAEAAVGSVFAGLQDCLEPGEVALLAADLPPEIRAFWDRARGPAPPKGEGEGRPGAAGEPVLLENVGRRAGYQGSAEAERAILAVFGALKEKLQERAGAWGENLPPAALSFWRRARTVDEQQEAYQCL